MSFSPMSSWQQRKIYFHHLTDPFFGISATKPIFKTELRTENDPLAPGMRMMNNRINLHKLFLGFVETHL